MHMLYMRGGARWVSAGFFFCSPSRTNWYISLTTEPYHHLSPSSDCLAWSYSLTRMLSEGVLRQTSLRQFSLTQQQNKNQPTNQQNKTSLCWKNSFLRGDKRGWWHGAGGAGDIDPNQEGWHHCNGTAGEGDAHHGWGVVCVQHWNNSLLTFYMQKWVSEGLESY